MGITLVCMVEVEAPPYGKRALVSVDVSAFREQVGAAAAEAGVGVSTWLREVARVQSTPADGSGSGGAIQSGLGDARPHKEGAIGAVGGEGESTRLRLDADLTRLLEEIRVREGLRSMTAVVRALAEGVLRTGTPADVHRSGRTFGLGDAVAQLGASNAQLAAVGRNLNQLVKVARVTPGKLSVADRMKLEETEFAVKRHVQHASAVVTELRPRIANQSGKR